MLRQIPLLVYVAATAIGVLQTLVQRAAADSCTTPEQDVDFFGSDIANSLGRPEDCCGRCLTNPNCAAFTWSDWAGGTCWLKSSTGTRTSSRGRISAVVVPNTNCGQTFTNTDFYGDDLPNGAVSGQYKSCCGACKARSGCVAWTWIDYLGGTCFLKRGTGNRMTRPGAISGLLSPPPDCTRVPNIDFFGSDIRNFRGSLDNCCPECVADSRCRAWTWNSYLGGTCWLKSSQGTPTNAPGTTSGFVNNRCQTETYPDKDITDSDIGNVKGTQESCCDQCKARAGCQGWAWNNFEGGTCWLKSASAPVINKPGVTAGKMK